MQPNTLTFPEERLALIRRRIDAEGRVSATDLAREFAISEDTVRRDLRDLAAAGLCQRVYGGALRVSPASTTITERLGQRPAAKAALAQAAATLIRAGQVVFIDTGSTNRAIADALPDITLTVVTNAPAVALALLGRPRCTVIILGGQVDPQAGGAFGARALRDLETIRPDLCFVGTCAVSREHGLCVFDSEEAAFKARLVAASAQLAVAVTNEKLMTTAPFAFAPLDAATTLIVEVDCPAPSLATLALARTDVLRASPMAHRT